MTEREALVVVGVVLAGFPSVDWPDETIALWVDELRPLAPVEAMAAARGVIRGHRWPTMAAFFAELAAIRERRADESTVPPERALPSGDRVTPPDEARVRLAGIIDKLRAATSLARVIPPETN